MSISTEPSTFEFAVNWLLSSEAFVRDAMGADAVDLDSARDQARARIHDEEAIDEPNEDEQNTMAPDQPPAVNDLPRTVIRNQSYERRVVGTGTWASRGVLEINVEVLVPEAYQINYADDSPETRAEKFANRKQWARRLWKTIASELEATRGLGDAQGNPYLNATAINGLPPADPEHNEIRKDWIGFVFEVPWTG